MPESIRNAIVAAFVAVLIAMVGVGLLLWSGRPSAAPSRANHGLSLLVTDRDGSLYDLSVKLQQMERRLGESQVISQRILGQLQLEARERARLASHLTGLEKEVRSLRKRVQEQEQAPSQRPAEKPAPQNPAPAPTPTSAGTATDTLPPSPPP